MQIVHDKNRMRVTEMEQASRELPTEKEVLK